MKTIQFTGIVVAFAMASVAYAGECDPGETIIKFSHVVSVTGHPKGEAAALFAQRVNERMDGRFCVKIYPGAVLYDDTEVFEALVANEVQMAAPSLAKLENYTLKLRVFELPFLFQDIDALNRFQNSAAGKSLLRSVDNKGAVGLGFWQNGMKQISANKPLLLPIDAQGLRF